MLSPYQTASTLGQALYNYGVRHAVISPGSRSTPLTLAFAHHDGFQKTVVLDERSAAFIALGIGKESGTPAVLICTSGTAAANYFPAIVEAKQSGVPLIVLTADRPPNMRGIGSSQTIDQIKLYGDHAVYFHEMGEPGKDPRDRSRIRYSARQAVSESIRHGGAAHLNMPFRKPLEPTDERIEKVRLQNRKQVKNSRSSLSNSERTVTLSEEISGIINRSGRPLLIAGPANRHHANETTALKIAEKVNSPVIAEPGSRISFHKNRVHHFEQFLRNDSARSDLEPDLILRFGDQPFTKSLLSALESWRDVNTIFFKGRNSWQDHEMNTESIMELSADDTLDIQSVNPKGDPFLNRWKKVDSSFQRLLLQSLKAEESLTDGHVFHHVSESIPDSWSTMLSNSLPPRDAALFGIPGRQVIVNRGAAGIDGILSTAIGAALATSTPTCCLTGDLAFLHDSNALLSLRHLKSPFVIIVINNNGGNIFRMLPIHNHTETYQSYFETPQNVAIESLAKAHNLLYSRISDIRSLDSISFSEIMTSKPLLIECVTNANKSMEMRRKLWEGA